MLFLVFLYFFVSVPCARCFSDCTFGNLLPRDAMLTRSMLQRRVSKGTVGRAPIRQLPLVGTPFKRAFHI